MTNEKEMTHEEALAVLRDLLTAVEHGGGNITKGSMTHGALKLVAGPGGAEARFVGAIESLIRESHGNSAAHGWWPELQIQDPEARRLAIIRTIPEKLMLVVTEVAEAVEDYRNGLDVRNIGYEIRGQPVVNGAGAKPVGFASEMADTLIRVFDLCGAAEVPLARALIEKLVYNRGRPHRHGGKVC